MHGSLFCFKALSKKFVTKMRKKLSHFWAHIERTMVMYYTEKNETKSIVSMVV